MGLVVSAGADRTRGRKKAKQKKRKEKTKQKKRQKAAAQTRALRETIVHLAALQKRPLQQHGLHCAGVISERSQITSHTACLADVITLA